MTRALFISFEGIDGSGKTCQARRLFEWMGENGFPAALTREPGGCESGERIREQISAGEFTRLPKDTQIKKFTKARREHLDTLILPALAEGKSVITDRYVDSTRVYQGIESAEYMNLVNRLHSTLIQKDPDVTVILDIPVETAAERLKNRRDGREADDFDLGITAESRNRYLDIAETFPKRCRVFDGARDEDSIAAEIQGFIRGKLDE